MEYLTSFLTTLPWTEMLTAGLPVAVLLLGQWTNHKFTRLRTTNEKIWEKRLVAYSKILTALDDAEKQMKDMEEGIDRFGGEIWDQPGFQKSYEQASVAYRQAQRIFSENALVMTPKFFERFKKLEADHLAVDHDNTLPINCFFEELKLIKAARPDLDQIARKEIHG